MRGKFNAHVRRNALIYIYATALNSRVQIPLNNECSTRARTECRTGMNILSTGMYHERLNPSDILHQKINGLFFSRYSYVGNSMLHVNATAEINKYFHVKLYLTISISNGMQCNNSVYIFGQ